LIRKDSKEDYTEENTTLGKYFDAQLLGENTESSINAALSAQSFKYFYKFRLNFLEEV
jgi:hypothetical protein